MPHRRTRREFSDSEEAAIREFIFNDDNFEVLYYGGRSQKLPLMKRFYKFFFSKIPESQTNTQKLYSKLRNLKVRFDTVLMQQFGDLDAVEEATDFQRETVVKRFGMFFDFYEATKRVRVNRPSLSLALSYKDDDSVTSESIRAMPSSRLASLGTARDVEDSSGILTDDRDCEGVVESNTSSLITARSSNVAESRTTTTGSTRSSSHSIRPAPVDKVRKHSAEYQAKKRALALKERHATLKLEALVGEMEYKKRSLELEEAKLNIEQERLDIFKQQIESQELRKKEEMEFDKKVFEQLMEAVDQKRLSIDDAVKMKVLIGYRALK